MRVIVLPGELDASTSHDIDESIVTYIWQFGDGGVATGMVAAHAYEHQGTYAVRLTVIDEDNLVNDGDSTITVVSVPVAMFQYMPSTPSADEVVNFFSYRSSDESGLVSYEWPFGDGHCANGWQAAHTFAPPGSHTVTLTGTNTYGLKASTTNVVGQAAPSLVGASGVSGSVLANELMDCSIVLIIGLGALVCALARIRARR